MLTLLTVHIPNALSVLMRFPYYKGSRHCLNIKLSRLQVSILVIFTIQLCTTVNMGSKLKNLTSNCNRTRSVLTEMWGIVTDGPDDYLKESYCEWLIKAPSESYFITLNITVLDTECSYDHLYIYDGSSYSSHLLAVFSGESSPSPVIAKSGSMLILLYSDTNYMRAGFEAEYFITECPLNCSFRGDCVEHHCKCDSDHTGAGCEVELCPENCNNAANQGSCIETQNWESKYCLCREGYSGDSCSLEDYPQNGDTWHWIDRKGDIFTPRTSHGTVFFPHLDVMYVFGGFDLNNVQDDLLRYKFSDGSWLSLKDEADSRPRKLRLHHRKDIPQPLKFFSDHRLQQGASQHTALDASSSRPHTLTFSVNSNNTVSVKLSDPSSPAGDRSPPNIRSSRMIHPSKDAKYKRQKQAVWPIPRFGHCLASFGTDFVSYGGRLASGKVSSELWLYNTTLKQWSLISNSTDSSPGTHKHFSRQVFPPALAYCTLTLVDEEWLYLFGGALSHGGFSNAMYRISPYGGWIWEKVDTFGGSALKARLVGHTTVFHAPTRSLYIYGGIKVNIARFSKLCDQLLVFNVDRQFWSEIGYPRGTGDNHYSATPSQYSTAPLERAFHSSLIAGNYMVIYGGYMHKHNEEEACYDNKIYLFHLGCHSWLSHELTPSLNTGVSPQSQGVYSHSTFLRHGNTIVVTGGFHGSVTNRVIAYVLPSTLIAPEKHPFNLDDACRGHKRQSSCVSNLECGWCPVDRRCYDRSRSANCTTNLQTSTCPGLCPTLSTCQSCVAQGGRDACGWCVRARTCLPRDPAILGQRSCGGPSHQVGWWGPGDLVITSMEDCVTLDVPSGLTLMQFKGPVDYSQPDYVAVIRDIAKGIWKPTDPRESHDQQTAFPSEYRLLGFLHPHYMEYGLLNKLYGPDIEPIRLVLQGYKLNATLSLSTDASPWNLKKVATLLSEKISSSEATRPDGEALIPGSGRLLLKLDMIPFDRNANSSINVTLLWSLGLNHPSPLSPQHLEPFGLGSTNCDGRSSCFACLTDYMCGWCSALRTCIPRNGSSLGLSAPCGPNHLPVTDTQQCEQCEDFIYCDDCIQTEYCEWLVEKAHCTRRGRNAAAVRTLRACPAPCHQRSTCAECLGEQGLCAWCQASKECFLFSLYTSVYQYGACHVWIDEDHTNLTCIRMSTKFLTSISAASPGPYRNSTPIASLFKDDIGQCQICESHTTCESCFSVLGCGWCFSEFDPTVGLCTSGNFEQPHKGDCAMLMTSIPLESTKNLSRVLTYHSGISWTYSSCPDVDECKLNLHNCHLNATCVNTDGGYNCTCPRGFAGNGRSTCKRTCYETCVHGKCSGSPDFMCECNLGWTGADCSINCGCNNHSKCLKVGVCDHCQGETTGDSCELCRPGSYGNATTVGCKKCECNGHWDTANGRCNQMTGQCFCTHNTEGHKCDRCKEGFYGNPRNGGRCYRQCTARGITVNATQGYFGTQKSARHPLDTCLWILSSHDSIKSPVRNFEGSRVLQVTIETIDINCEESSLYIYQGLPDFLSVKSRERQNLVGTFCRGHSSYPITLEAVSGVMTIFYEKSAAEEQGFTASYEVLRCPENPGKNRECVSGKPVCNEGWRGVQCDVPVCPEKCSDARGRGRCDPIYGRCVCSKEFVGENCTIARQDHLVILQELFNPLKISSSQSYLETVLPRFGHTVIVDHQGSLWVFGGYSLSRGPLNDIQQFDTRNKTWVQVTVNVYPGSQPPSLRYFHASAYVVSHNQMFVYGGMNKTHFLNDFWKFSIGTESWTRLSVRKELPPLAGHTLTCRGETSPQSLVLIGGVSEEYGLLEEVWEFDFSTYSWQKMDSNGAKPVGIVGHSTVYHESTHSFYVYGGYSFKGDKFALNPFLYVFDYASQRWSLLPPDLKINLNPESRPAPRAFHTAVTTDEYMVLIGGYISDRLNSNQDLLVHSYKCNMWIPLNSCFITVAGHQLPTPLLGVSAAIYGSSIYLVGGFSGTVHGSLVEITIPQDLCTLNSNKTQCKDRIGCANCVVYNSNGTNTSYCYSHSQPEPRSCLRPPGKRTSFNGIKCDAAIVESRECYEYKTCAECLAYWPSHKEAKQQCQWCITCPRGKCIPKSSNCSSEASCQTNAKHPTGLARTTDVNKCPELSCAASDCRKCLELGCMWAQRASVGSEKGFRKMRCLNPSFRNTSKDGNGWVSPTVCPKPCHLHRTCKDCLQVDTLDEGFSECHWSPRFRKCLSHTSVALHCLAGTCGLLLKHNNQCPPPCTSYTQCNQCLSQAQCGWCGIETTVGGLGICAEGRLEEPWMGRCRHLSYESVAKNDSLMSLHGLRGAAFGSSIQNRSIAVNWHYGKCPPENECQNNYHTCNPVKEVCVDQEVGYTCKCASGYTMNEDTGVCQPVCRQGCKHGTCVEPDNCSCEFSFVGDDCSIRCLCNGHSDCAGPNQLKTCLKCHNNTMEQQCQRCKPNFVGNPEKNEKCRSCLDYCHGHTDLCTSERVLRNLNVSQRQELNLDQLLLAHLDEDEPLTNASCLKCANMTEGPRCGSCLPGYFRGTTNRSAPCRPCQCNGHGSICDPEWGNNCNCQNNTETPCNGRMRGGVPGGKEEEKDCWERQCSKCKEGFFGNPINGHQCYRQISIEGEYCLDPLTQIECRSDPSPLPRGRVVLFAFQPRFNNVDIRLFLDISRGGVDAYFTTFPEGFVVVVNSSSSSHLVEVDSNYPVVESLPTNPPPPPMSLERAKLLSPRYDVYFNKYSAQPLIANRNVSPLNVSPYFKHTVEAKGLKTYFTLSDSNHFLVVKNLTDRLVVTLPKQSHNLTQAKFYIVLHGVGGSGEARADGDSFGAIYFRQDQPRIDLFVFFSVFFSCFFLFLAVCVVVWKVKQSVDQRRARRRHVVEMLHMAKRPFSSATLVLHASDNCAGVASLVDGPVSDPTGVWSPARRKKGQKRERTFDRFEIGPVAVEPTDDGVAAVVTIVVQLPGVCIGGVHGSLHGSSNSPPQRLALGSSLCLVSRIYPPTSKPFHLRRRTSHLST